MQRLTILLGIIIGIILLITLSLHANSLSILGPVCACVLGSVLGIYLQRLQKNK